jgi:hypothetical protein
VLRFSTAAVGEEAVMAGGDGRSSAGRLGPGQRRGLAVVVVAVALLGWVVPALANGPETGSDPSVTLTVTPSDFVGVGETVTVTGTGFPANAPGTIRQCGGTIAAPQCDQAVAATFMTTATGTIPPTPVVAKRIIDTGTTTFNCGVQACALLATAGGRSSQHHLGIAGAGTLVPASTSPSSTAAVNTLPTLVVSPTTIALQSFWLTAVCPVLRRLVTAVPFVQQLLTSLRNAFGCPPIG